MKVYICDDDKETISDYAKLLDTLAKKNKIEITIHSFTSGEALLFNLSNFMDYADIIYLDILMGKLNGIDTGKKLRDLGCQAEIIYLTTTKDYVFDAYDISPVNYLLKNEISLAKFEEVFLRVVSLAKKKVPDMFICKSGNIQKLIPMNEISYFEIWKRVVKVHYKDNETFSFYSTMKHLDSKLSHKDFIRTHRSFIVNLNYIVSFGHNKVILKKGIEVPIGITYIEQLEQAFKQYIHRTSIHNFF